MATVYISAKLPKIASELLNKAGIHYDVFDGDGLITKDKLIRHVKDCKVLITPLSTQVDKDVIDAAPKLKLIANFGAGFNNIDIKYARSKAIDVTNTPFVSSTATAEVTSGLVVALMRRIVEGDRVMHSTGFKGWAPLFFLGHELAGKTLGIVGLGSIGRGVAQRLHAFDMKIIYTQRHQASPEIEAHYSAEYVTMDELLKRSDVVTLHCPLTPETHHLIDNKEINMMKDTAMLVNCARGPVINEDAVLKALQEKRLGGAALDVYEAEPNVAEGFKKLDNVILTPHIGNASFEARDAMAEIVAKNAIAVLDRQNPKYVVNMN